MRSTGWLFRFSRAGADRLIDPSRTDPSLPGYMRGSANGSGERSSIGSWVVYWLVHDLLLWVIQSAFRRYWCSAAISTGPYWPLATSSLLMRGQVGLGAGDDDIGIGAITAKGARLVDFFLGIQGRSRRLWLWIRTVTSPSASMPSVTAWTTNSCSVLGAWTIASMAL